MLGSLNTPVLILKVERQLSYNGIVFQLLFNHPHKF